MTAQPSDVRELSFTVDAALLRELGERLVGRPHIALAELIKNSYDADARHVVLSFTEDSIEIVDDGHGMSIDEFQNHWMRVGTTHKATQGVSRLLSRRLTGSKGVGRLAVQFLGARVDVSSVSSDNHDSEFIASVDWDEATTAGNLTSAKARLTAGKPSREFAKGSRHGTAVLLRRLKHAWLPFSIAEVAREIRDLAPPFRPNPRVPADGAASFEVELVTNNEAAQVAFGREMRAYLDSWYAQIAGRLKPPVAGRATREVELSLRFSDGGADSHTYEVSTSSLHECEFEIRVFYLANRQGRGVRVEAARDYIRKYGGVHIYDAGFHLPFYGPNTDWLDIERDHSHRMSVSALLPKELQVSEGLNYLPTQGRLFGVVHVDTGNERAAFERDGENPANALTLLVTRDRLADNDAFRSLRNTVRWALDYYAMAEARRAMASAEKVRDTHRSAAADELSLLQSFRARLEPKTYSLIERGLKAVASQRELEAEVLRQREGMLAALATAGIAALAYDHELGKQLALIRSFVQQIEGMSRSGRPTLKALTSLAEDLRRWEERASGVRALFAGVTDEESRVRVERFGAREVLTDVRRQASALLRGVEVDISQVDAELLLPRATYAEWAALFQNVFTNALNAMLDSKEKRIVVRTAVVGRVRQIVVEDTGRGVSLHAAPNLFKPFERETATSAERRALGLGGTGLGLTIVKMIASNRKSDVQFVAPSTGFSTAFKLSWSEGDD